MQIVLLERIGGLGQMGDVVKVRDGYARNFLLPKGKALRATKVNLARFESERAQLEVRNLELKKEAEAVAVKLNGKRFVALRQASESGHLYGSVTTRDIAEIVTEGGFTASRTQILLAQPIKTLGQHPVHVRLHPEVDVSISINVARTIEEAERQARGEDMSARRDRDDDEDTAADEALEDSEHTAEDEAETA